ncbi:MAG TPA: thiamine phosphate synthase [Rhizomicrobium sp.]|nr:thiamine phosphate synthase [Rhizomicrobium sp.]
MADNLARAQLARLAWQHAEQTRSRLPALVLFTDDARLPDPLPSIRALPRGSMVVLRERNSAKRRALASAIARIARKRRLVWIIADDPHLATELHAHGVHFPEAKLPLATHWRTKRRRWLITSAAHSLAAGARAARAGADAIFLAPAFATRSHAGQNFLGSLRVRIIANKVTVPVYALGGVDAHSARRLSGASLAGLAAVGALAI